MPNRKPDYKSIRLDLSPAEHQDLVDLAAVRRRSMSALVRDVVTGHLEQHRRAIDAFRELSAGPSASPAVPAPEAPAPAPSPASHVSNGGVKPVVVRRNRPRQPDL